MFNDSYRPLEAGNYRIQPASAESGQLIGFGLRWSCEFIVVERARLRVLRISRKERTPGGEQRLRFTSDNDALSYERGRPLT